MKTSMHSERNSRSEQRLSTRIQARHDLNDLCAVAVQQQIERGDVDATHLRNRRRYLARQILKRIPHAGIMSPRKLMHAAAMVLAMWGFAGVSMPMQAEAAPLFKHVLLDGFSVGSYATPTFADIDGDGDLDAFVGEGNGTVKYYRNTGTNTAPVFEAANGTTIVNPLAGVAVSYAAPSFADIDGDGDLDVFIGELFGTVKFYRNTGTATAPVFTATGVNDPNTGVAISNPLAGFNPGSIAAPSFADIDNDGDLDAFVGNSFGTVKFYRNKGTATAPVFAAANGTTIINPLNGFDVGFNSAPSFADIDNDGDLDAFVGERFGTVKFYRNTGTATAAVFAAANGTTIINPLNGFDVGSAAAPSFADIDNDGDLDAFVGAKLGTMKFYRNNGTNTAPNFAADAANNPLAGFDVGNESTPSFVDIDNDGDLDAFVGEKLGTVRFYRNNGSNTVPNFVADAANNPLAAVAVSRYAIPAFADIDNDGDLDAFVGEFYGTVKFYRNNGSNTAPVFAADAANNPLAGVAVGTYAAPTFADIDGDGDLDAFVGEFLGTVKFYRNNGSNTAPVFAADAANNPLAGVAVGNYAIPAFADIDNDGDLDVFVGEKYGAIKLYRNTGTATAPVFAADPTGNPLAGFSLGRGSAPFFADIDNDGDLDAFVGEQYGTVQFFENFDVQKLVLPGGAGNLLFSATGGTIPAASMALTALVNPPTGNFPFGKISYNITTTPGGTVTVRVVFPSTLPTGFQIFKIDAADNFTVIPATQFTQINATTIDVTLTDGGAFDLDGNATNGVIVDPITLGVPAAAATPPVATGGVGGCVIQSDAGFDPMLPLLAAMAMFMAWIRRKRT